MRGNRVIRCTTGILRGMFVSSIEREITTIQMITCMLSSLCRVKTLQVGSSLLRTKNRHTP